MHRIASKQLKWQSAALFVALLVGVAALSAMVASGCGSNDITIHDCPDSGTPDGGGGGGGAGGAGGSRCK